MTVILPLQNVLVADTFGTVFFFFFLVRHKTGVSASHPAAPFACSFPHFLTLQVFIYQS
jgi:hypothetical protein